jgi:LPPG:FO 2-phospho-L-lactate transferase
MALPTPMTTILCGGVGGVKLVDGLAAVLADPAALTVIVNTGDDWRHLGLLISPDVDTVMYTLAGVISRERGWGLEGETWAALEMMGRYGLPTWFRLGDRDLATHVTRTFLMAQGRRLTEITRILAASLGVAPRILPMSDDPVSTVVHTPAGRLPFQEYFVKRRAEDPVTAIEFDGLDRARPSAEVIEAIKTSRLIIVAPSNPLVSIRPILALPGVEAALAASGALRLGVTPIVGGAAVKGPTVEMLTGTGIAAEPLAVAALYEKFLDVFVLDVRDRALARPLVAATSPSRQIDVECADTLMSDQAGRRRLAREILAVAAGRGVEIGRRPL